MQVVTSSISSLSYIDTPITRMPTSEAACSHVTFPEGSDEARAVPAGLGGRHICWLLHCLEVLNISLIQRDASILIVLSSFVAVSTLHSLHTGTSTAGSESSARRPADVFLPSLSGSPTVLDSAVVAPQYTRSLAAHCPLRADKTQVKADQMLVSGYPTIQLHVADCPGCTTLPRAVGY